jgi:glutathione synthase/RimK-type ligase-like ATP-grasp enzyme/ribosomal protein S18 acetylase RimI-like enzyme
MKKTKAREASLEDLDYLLELEKSCFPSHRQSSRRSLRNSLVSPNHHVYVLEKPRAKMESLAVGSATVICHSHSLRIYSIAIHSDFRGQGLGQILMEHIVDVAQNRGFDKITLEADCNNHKLVEWYRQLSFEVSQVLEDYYGPDEPAYRMAKSLRSTPEGMLDTSNLVVVDSVKKWDFDVPDVEIVSAKDYLCAERFRNSERYHVLNLCHSYKTHSMGYYVSLLASARNHQVVPLVMTVKDVSSPSIVQSLFEEIKDVAQERLKSAKTGTLELTVILGCTPSSEYSDLAKRLFSLFKIPFFSISIVKAGSWKIQKLRPLNLASVSKDYPETCAEAVVKYFQKKRRRRVQLKNYKYDLAILVDPEEKTPPSCPLALNKFRKAAEQVGFFVEFITKVDYRRICEFDALFIRETTAIENHTYKFARHAYTEGLVVIDDPWSILRCSNKIYLQERLARGRIKQPKAWLLTKNAVTSALLQSLTYPLVLKLPESSFSLGVYQVKNQDELHDKLKTMFACSDLLIAQEFLESEFDWRIGVMDNTPLFACKYYMANGHWQIYNWEQDNPENPEDFSGNFETVPINQVPAHILKAALKSSALIGDGLYGVDLKDVKGQAYVIEINDNPNIDAGIEDLLLQDDLYLRVMTSFFNRIERERQQPRYLV